ncbi:helix-turn-helix transcriptional regulator [Microbacterium album]|uniref:WYL domain-containing protein n=1 Tax=Microbacterium album TaxID=2053191 RepID=A0A917ICL9_9MICO|nr:WYL domain-containing protein [Microbacterium album]GGH35199.1 WYL domain-containing protein [Microbacterium album]
MSQRIPAEERQLNLVVALMATEIGLTKQQILETVSGYRQRTTSSSDALEKMFERDKEDLRELGVPIETLGDHADPHDLREARYRIPKAEYDLPSDIDFTPAELAILRLAGSVWSEGSLSKDAHTGLRKIRALGIEVDEPIIGFAPRLTVREPSFAPLRDAIEACRVVAFDYLKPGEPSPRRRVVRPLALVDYEGRWHVSAHDVAADGERMFLLSRIVSDVEPTGERFEPALRDGAGERAMRGLEEVAARNRALLEVTPGSEAALRLTRRSLPAPQGILVPYVDAHILADELASYGPEVRVVEPAPLRAAVIERLRAARDVHRDGAA